jgi:hypothetical protein
MTFGQNRPNLHIRQNYILHDKTWNIFFALKQRFCAFEIFSIFSNGGHVGWKADLSDIILKGDHPSTIPAKFGLIWHSGLTFKEDFYMSFGQNRHNLHIRQKSAKPYIF